MQCIFLSFVNGDEERENFSFSGLEIVYFMYYPDKIALFYREKAGKKKSDGVRIHV